MQSSIKVLIGFNEKITDGEVCPVFRKMLLKIEFLQAIVILNNSNLMNTQ